MYKNIIVSYKVIMDYWNSNRTDSSEYKSKDVIGIMSKMWFEYKL